MSMDLLTWWLKSITHFGSAHLAKFGSSES